MRINLSNASLPGWQCELVDRTGTEQQRKRVYRPDGTCAGDVVYLRRRKRAGGSEYGWRPAINTHGNLKTQVDAVRLLDR